MAHDPTSGLKAPAAREMAPTWLGRPILHPDHVSELDVNSAINEFHGKLPRHEAEQAAHDSYVKSQREKAAAHHLRGMRGAHAMGDMDGARKHHAMYSLHMKALGHDPTGAPPPGISYMSRNSDEPLHRFKAHKADLFALPPLPKDDGAQVQKSEPEIQERLGVLARAARLISILRGNR